MNDVTRASTRAADVARRAPSVYKRLTAVPRRRSDGHPVPPEPVPADALAAMTRAVAGTGLRVHTLRTADPVPDTPRPPVGEPQEVRS